MHRASKYCIQRICGLLYWGTFGDENVLVQLRDSHTRREMIHNTYYENKTEPEVPVLLMNSRQFLTLRVVDVPERKEIQSN